MQNPYFGQLLTAMVTPFNNDGVDALAAAEFAEWLLAHGSDGLVVEGSTGESATMTLSEKEIMLKAVVERVGGKCNIVVGAGTNSTASTIELVKTLEKYRPDGFLIVGPYYNKPTQKGYYEHFAAVAKTTLKPIIIYNVPGRTGSNILPETVACLANDFKNIVAIKEASGDVTQVAELYRLLPKSFTIYSGDDSLVLPFMSVGATGLISVVSNIDGKSLQYLMNAYQSGDIKTAADINAKISKLIKAMFIESNPIPVKYAVSQVTGINVGKPRLPLTPISDMAKIEINNVLHEFGLRR
ncbi:MAG: 4-hydroxy-tetrahydrodipicolinate synthase [Phascolarctobacterium sp.]|nr:4-hydroxy-tetrahydrodipicolinate synthase [Candidatus Phascolarctobacterium caballi]